MIGYITIGVADMDRAKKFYNDLFADYGAKTLIDMDRIAMIGKSMAEPMIGVCVPFDENDPHPGNGNMIAFAAGSKKAADKLYARS